MPQATYDSTISVMSMVIVNQSQVPNLLPMGECIQVMEEVLADLARGECQLPLRQIMWLPDKRGALGLMPSHWKTAGAGAARLNPLRGRPEGGDVLSRK